ncbi:MAG: HipA domain-containing protein [Thermoanaerobaculia bacterium]
MNRLDVYLNALPVGRLERKGSDTWTFQFFDSYLELEHRPVLSQSFEDDLERAHSATLLLPPFFSNLLPEGALRRFLSGQLGVNEQREAQLMAYLGTDLPGAVRVLAGGTGEEGSGTLGVPAIVRPLTTRRGFRFSLAGLQLKFPAEFSEQRWTLPASDSSGKWILKLPDPHHPDLPSLEYSDLQWARRAGIDVPNHRLVPVEQIDPLPVTWTYAEGFALGVRRYDRLEDGRRVHQEDFAQVLGVFPDEKYEATNYESLANIVRRICPPGDFRQLVRRLVFMVLSGNGDAHLKNWSLSYPNELAPALGPAYDLVSTRVYPDYEELALNFVGTKRFRGVDRQRFRRLARKLDEDEQVFVHWVDEDAQRIRDAWRAFRPESPAREEHKRTIDRHLDQMLI